MLALVVSGGACGQAVVSSVSELRKLSAAEAAEGRTVGLESQVVRLGPSGSHFFVFSGAGGGAYVQRSLELAKELNLKVGDMVRIHGKTYPGEFYPAIMAEKVELVGTRELPEARPFQLDEIHRPASDCDWVSVEGRLIASSDHATQFGRFYMLLEINDSIQLGVHLPARPGLWKRLPELMFRRVRFNAVVGTLYNGQRQLTGRVFIVDSIDDFKLLDEEGLHAATRNLPIQSLMRVHVDPREAIRTQGVVTHASANEIFLRGEETSLRVAVLNSNGLKEGQTVEVEGFVWPQPISPAFRALKVRVRKEAVGQPVPKEVELDELFGSGQPEDLLDSRMNYELVRIQAQLLDIGKSFGISRDVGEESGQQSLLCRSGSHVFEARLPEGMAAIKALAPGAELELTGICHLMHDENMLWRLYSDGLWLQVRGEGDVVVLQPAPWWTPKRLLWVAGIALGASALFLVWILALHKTVDRQTGIISKQVERETILDERARIARELHDNLDQGLTGAAIRLQGCRKFLETGFKRHLELLHFFVDQEMVADPVQKQKLVEHLSTVEKDSATSRDDLQSVQDMLGYCGEESRSQILDLRGGPLERMDLPAALRETLEPLADECGARLDIVVQGEPRRLKLRAERNFLLVAKESATNAARHAAPSLIRLTLAYRPDSIVLDIVDDGSGYNVSQDSPAGHFGLQGMRERANKLGAEFKIESVAGEGTSVHLELATVEWELE
ncbi:Sensor histidine kinase LiaS [Pontiella desulfatans]|uniref:Sensor histidine kinase LiaS n=1 Tax=Pontiella desulfatans TaxID=2750659 RepID=A0A6C2TYU0_PONDE|nr:Sensor histidine kinase LiaS [Pontiella desulfatans]